MGALAAERTILSMRVDAAGLPGAVAAPYGVVREACGGWLELDGASAEAPRGH
jgi:hypothetical protein